MEICIMIKNWKYPGKYVAGINRKNFQMLFISIKVPLKDSYNLKHAGK